MGLFDNIKKGMQEEANRKKEVKELKAQARLNMEEVVMQKLSACPLLDCLVKELQEDKSNPWLFMANDYYESRVRKVTIENDSFEIKWSGSHQEQYIIEYRQDGSPRYGTKTVEDIYGRVAYSYTKSGYVPLHEYEGIDEVTGLSVTIPVKEVINCWTKVVRERLVSEFPSLIVTGISSEGSSFLYTVPMQEYADWF